MPPPPVAGAKRGAPRPSLGLSGAAPPVAETRRRALPPPAQLLGTMPLHCHPPQKPGGRPLRLAAAVKHLVHDRPSREPREGRRACGAARSSVGVVPLRPSREPSGGAAPGAQLCRSMLCPSPCHGNQAPVGLTTPCLSISSTDRRVQYLRTQNGTRPAPITHHLAAWTPLVSPLCVHGPVLQARRTGDGACLAQKKQGLEKPVGEKMGQTKPEARHQIQSARDRPA